MARFLVVPEWQGSPSSRGMQLIDGAMAIAGDLPRAACTTIEVPMEAGEALGTGIRRLSALQRIREEVEQHLDGAAAPTVVVGGDCGVAVPAIGHAAAKHPALAVVWLDAHPDLHTPETSPSGAYSGMALRAVLGDGVDGMALPAAAVPADRVILGGARLYDPAEEHIVADLGITVLDPADLGDPDALARAVQATDAEAVFVHVDLDVLDPSAITGVTDPVPFGVSVADLVAGIARLKAAVPLVGASLSGFAPVSPAAAVDDLGAILRIVGALA